MKFRYARHTTDIYKIEKFYTEIVGFEKLSGFEDHDFYSGLFLGLPDSDWHLEFTTSTEKPVSKFDEDDILVFYINFESELSEIKKSFIQKTINLEIPKNLYWRENGIMISDLDGFKVVFAIKRFDFTK